MDVKTKWAHGETENATSFAEGNNDKRGGKRLKGEDKDGAHIS